MGTNRQKTSKTQENNHFGLLCTKQKHRNTDKPKKQNHQNPKKDQKNTLYHSGKPPLFLFFLLSHVCKAGFAENTIKIVFSAEHRFLGITDSKTPFGAPSQNGTFATKSAILGFPCACWNPYFIVFCHLEWPQERTIFPKQIVATKMRVSFLPSEHK